MKRVKWMSMVAAIVSVGACGDDGGGSASPSTAAKRMPDNAAALHAGDSTKSLAALAQIYADLQIIYQDKMVDDLQSRSGGLAVARGALTAGCVQQSGTTTTYTDCSEGPSTFNGSASVSGDRVTFDVVVDVDPDAYNGPISQATAQAGAGAPKMTLEEVSVHETGDLTVTATTLDGTIDAVITLDMTIEIPGFGSQAAPQETPLHAVFDLDRDAAGCAVGGTLTITSGSTTAVAEYGPACGQVTLR